MGGLSVLGLGLPELLARPNTAPAPPEYARTFGKAKNVIFLWLQGGPPQHETFDPKPDAPAEIRGEFKPIQTTVPGVHFCELLPRTAAIAHKLAVVRSLCTHSDLHDASAYWVLTGYRYRGAQSRQISPTDWPYLGSIVKMLKPSTKLPSYTSVWLPDVMRLNDNVQPAGQTAGFLGRRWEPERVICDPADPHFQIQGLALPAEVPPLRLNGRQGLLAQVDRHFAAIESTGLIENYDRKTQEAFALLTTGKAREAFALHKEPEAVRDRYGRYRWGQCVLLARRLVEAGARLVHVNWPREEGDTAIDNPMWDTHAQNSDRLQDILCPQFDVTFTALIDDLERRGLLDETLVVAIGEFGRTPKINREGGRDHWGHVFSFVMAGAGIRTAQVIGASDKRGAYPVEAKMEPQELTATICHLLGIDHHGMFRDQTNRPHKITEGEPIRAILGSGPATTARTTPTGSLAMSPAFTPDYLLNTGFEEETPLVQVNTRKRWKGWMASHLADPTGPASFGAWLARDLPRTGKQHACLGITGRKGGKLRISQSARFMLTQEVRNPRAGQFVLTAHVSGGGASAELFRDAFLKHFQCRLVLFGYSDPSKNPLTPRVFDSADFTPSFTVSQLASAPAAYQRVELKRHLRGQDAGAKEINQGVGVAIVVEKVTPGVLDWSALGAGASAFVRVDDVELRFVPRPRDDSVQV